MTPCSRLRPLERLQRENATALPSLVTLSPNRDCQRIETLARLKEMRYRPAMRLFLAFLLTLWVVSSTYAADPASLDKSAGYLDRCGVVPLPPGERPCIR